jgi:ketosteroid isomerase-like protein
MKKLLYTVIAFLFITACSTPHDKEKLKEEVVSAEKAFEQMAAEKGIAEAFYSFADENAVINRGNDSLIYGKDAIRNFYEKKNFTNVKLSWSPDFTEVSETGDLAWTYGKYLWVFSSAGQPVVEYRGVFHTVWKRQPDGSWKYVWD